MILAQLNGPMKRNSITMNSKSAKQKQKKNQFYFIFNFPIFFKEQKNVFSDSIINHRQQPIHSHKVDHTKDRAVLVQIFIVLMTQKTRTMRITHGMAIQRNSNNSFLFFFTNFSRKKKWSKFETFCMKHIYWQWFCFCYIKKKL